jgi:methylthioribose-1-phosphate isomerase
MFPLLAPSSHAECGPLNFRRWAMAGSAGTNLTAIAVPGHPLPASRRRRPGPAGLDPPVFMSHTQNVETRALRWVDRADGPAVTLLDQTRLPAEEIYLTCTDTASLVDAIGRLAVRGAPLLGVAGAFGVALAACRGEDVAAAANALARARPTAVNLSWGTGRALAAWQAAARADSAATNGDQQRLAAQAALAEARSIAAADAAASAAIAANGLDLVPDRARILTHCNTGALVSAGEGTAFAIILAAHRAGRLAQLWVDETRPLLQGGRLTAYEARRAGLPYAVLADAAAASLMAAGQVNLVITGADRIAADGSVANKIGTYSLAVLARHHGVPFLVAAPLSTVDFTAADGAAIEVEHRAADEVTSLAGTAISPAGSSAYNPAFDVTPAALVTAVVTERGTARPVNAGTLHRLGAAPPIRVTAPAGISVER